MHVDVKEGGRQRSLVVHRRLWIRTDFGNATVVIESNYREINRSGLGLKSARRDGIRHLANLSILAEAASLLRSFRRLGERFHSRVGGCRRAAIRIFPAA